ncbi:MAG: hypothetical protein LBJ00_04170 [Planctomycetaceae bacterium]|nr:hypothetical protein [Planctomycetaceae bacterium]
MKFPKLNTQAQQREAVAQGRSLSPYRLRYTYKASPINKCTINNQYTFVFQCFS